MLAYSDANALELSERFEEAAGFERIRARRDGNMPVSRSLSAVRGRRRNKSSNRTRRQPQRISGAHQRRNSKWQRRFEV